MRCDCGGIGVSWSGAKLRAGTLLQINGNIFLGRFGDARHALGLVLWGLGRKVVPLSGYR